MLIIILCSSYSSVFFLYYHKNFEDAKYEDVTDKNIFFEESEGFGNACSRTLLLLRFCFLSTEIFPFSSFFSFFLRLSL